MKKKVLSVLLTLAMVLTLTTVTALAATPSTSGGEWDTGSITSNIELKADATIKAAITVTAESTISGSFSLKFDNNGSITVNEGIKLTIASATSVETENSGSISFTLKKGATLALDTDEYKNSGETDATLTLDASKNVTLTSGTLKVPVSKTIKINSKDYKTGEAGATISSDGALTEGEVTLPADGSVTAGGAVISTQTASTVKVSVSGATATVSGDTKITIDSKEYTPESSGKMTVTGGAVTVTSGTVTLGSGAKVTLNGEAKAKVGGSGKEISGADNTVTATDASTATVTGTSKITVDGKDYTGSATLTVASDGTVTLTNGEVTLSSDAEITAQSTKIKGNTVKVKDDGTVTVPSDTTATIGTEKTYKAVGAQAVMKVTGESNITLNSGKVELGNDAQVTLSGEAIAKRGKSGTEIKGNGVIVKGSSSGAIVTGTGEATIGDSKKYTLGASASLTVADSNGDVELTTGSVTIGTDTAIKYSNQTYTAKSATTKLTVSGSDLELASGSVEVPDGQSIKVGTGKLTAAGSAKATVGISGDAATVTSGKVSLDTNAKVKVQGKDVSGNGIEVDKDGKVTVAANKTAKIGEDSFAAAGDKSELTVSSSGVTVDSIGASSGTLKVTDDDKSLNVTYKNITFKGDAYTLSEDTDDVKVALESGKKVTATFSGEQKIKTESTLKNGDNEDGAISDKTITGKSGATVEFTGGSSDITVKGTGNTKVGSGNDGTLEVSTSSPTTPGSSSSTPSTTVDKPVTDAASGETKVDVNTNSTTSGTTANATVSGTNMDKAVDSAVTEAEKQGTAPVVEVEVKTSARADSLNVTLPAAALEKLAEAEDASLVVTSDIAEVALDNTALSALADQATGSTVTLEVAPVAASELNAAQAAAAGEAAVMDLSLVSNGVVIHDYDGGRITVTLPYKLAEGKDPASVQVYFLDDNGALTPCDTSYADGKVVFTTTHLSKYVIGDESMAPVVFDDVPDGIWYAGAVNYAVKNDLMTGIGGNLFAPDTTTTRAMMVTLLYNLEGKPAVDYAMTYADVPETWFTEAVRWATSEEIVTGYSETAFGPEDTITREQMAVLLCQYAAYKGYDVTAAADLSGYSDAGSVSSWAEGAMRWAVAEGLISGKTADILDPAGDASRAEIAVLLMNFCEKIAK